MRRNSNPLLVLGVFLLLGFVLPARANVFVSNIKVNGATNNAILLPNQQVAFSYVLNEPATNGAVTLKIFQGPALIRSITANWPDPATQRGSNVLVWDGMDSAGNPATQGAYSATITASTIGYNCWTQISDDNVPGPKIYDPFAIAVNNNTNSPYYGRIFVGNAASSTWPGLNGIYKFNADGSDADEGAFGTAAYDWKGNKRSPWKIEVSQDDSVFVNDFNDFYGNLLAFDQTISTYTPVLDSSNWPSDTNGYLARLSGPSVVGTGTNTQIWMTDAWTPSLGILRWNLTTNGNVAQGDLGQCVVSAGPDSNLSQAALDISVATNGLIYAIQSIGDSTDPSPRVLCFPASAGDAPDTTAIWTAGVGADSIDTNAPPDLMPLTNLDNALGVSVDPSDSYVAVAVYGSLTDMDHWTNGGLIILNAATGGMVESLDTGSTNSYTDATWDRVGNLYGTQEEKLRIFSPPGANQSTTPVLPLIQKLNSLDRPVLSASQPTNGEIQITLQGQENVAYAIETSTDLTGWTGIATNSASSSTRLITVSQTADTAFYRAVVISQTSFPKN